MLLQKNTVLPSTDLAYYNVQTMSFWHKQTCVLCCVALPSYISYALIIFKRFKGNFQWAHYPIT